MSESIRREDLQKILEASVNAPSGSNSQPWKFRVKGNVVDIIAEPEKDHPVLNFRNRGTWIAHGALIENIKISASAFGYNVDISIFPSEKEENLAASVIFTPGSVMRDAFYESIAKRTTNRKRFKEFDLSEDQLNEFLSAAVGFDGVRVRFTNDKKAKRLVGRALSLNEILTLENEKLHELFFEEIVWSREEEQKKKSGLYLETMELAAPKRTALKFLKKWRVMRFCNRMHFARRIAADNSKVYASGSGLGVLVVPDTDASFLIAGRAMERLWLKAMQMGLSFHLITGTLFFWQKVHAGESEGFSKEHIGLLESGYHDIQSAFGVSDGVIALAFRVGYDGEPTARSSKKQPVIQWI
jgi:hypothetical protein